MKRTLIVTCFIIYITSSCLLAVEFPKAFSPVILNDYNLSQLLPPERGLTGENSFLKKLRKLFPTIPSLVGVELNIVSNSSKDRAFSIDSKSTSSETIEFAVGKVYFFSLTSICLSAIILWLLVRLSKIKQKLVRESERHQETVQKLLRFSYAVEQSSSAMVITNTEGLIEYVNPKFTEQTGYSQEEAYHQKPNILKFGDQDNAFYQDLWKTITQGKQWVGEFHNKTKSGESYWEIASISPIVDQGGQITSFLAVKEDITHHKLYEQELQRLNLDLKRRADENLHTQAKLREHLNFLQELIDAIPMPIFYKNNQGVYIGCNRTFSSNHGLSHGEIIGKTAFNIASELQADRYKELDDELFAEGGTQQYEDKMKYADGSVHDIIFQKALFKNADGSIGGLIGVVSDVTDLNKAQGALRVKDQAIACSINAIAIADLSGRITYVNEAFLKQWQCTEDDIIGKRLQTFWKINKKNLRIFEHVLKERSWIGELRVGRGKTEILDILLSINTVQDEQEQSVCLMVSFIDITKRKKAERELKHQHDHLEELVEGRTAELSNINQCLEKVNEELKSLDQLKDGFIATVSHELRTPLASILGYAEAMIDCDLPPEQNRHFTEIIVEEAERLTLLIENILDLSCLSTGNLDIKLERVNLDVSIRRAIESIQGLSRVKEINIAYDSKDCFFFGDEDRITQVVINLLGNAVKFTPAYSRIQVEVHQGPECFIVSVKDQGPGIEEEFLEHIFQKFTQITRKGNEIKGTGLGLSISRGIIDAHQGQIWAESSSTGGMFCFSVPYQVESSYPRDLAG
ncbi:MAG: hypothetical protein COB67_01955 [SAR324 cluster bacterium]|uniref:histidine kinase n=1 Tax=SAR324 cluster bacterium TaxID=2024889 RepID=A0A2A4TBC8_9DELT|nr:MAG: hypothetical protein COB67_01955 [SAR324 cluster bacterium]